MYMRIDAAQSNGPCLTVRWDDQVEASYPYIFLRDNDAADLHPQTQERIFDLTGVELDIASETVSCDGERVTLRWQGREEPSHYSSGWLRDHRPGIPSDDPARVEREYWDAEFAHHIPRIDEEGCRGDGDTLCSALQTLKRFGLVIVSGLPDALGAGYEFGDLIGFKRETNFGVTFEVISKPDPNNLAYTSMALALHTDLSNQELIPGYQFLHCYRNEAVGGDSVFADGFKVCADLRDERPELYRCLTETLIPCRFHDRDYDIRARHPVIQLGFDGEMREFIFNAHLADIPDMPVDVLLTFYRAYQELMNRVRSPRYKISLKMKPGEMVVFDNRRVLHGRTAFDPATGERCLQGYYIDRGEVDSRIRLLARRSPDPISGRRRC
jgi:gamma-butyrobetaine dioxygenase